MIPNENPVISNSLWSATANAMPDCPTLIGEVEADVAIIGAGFTGLSAALHLAEAGKKVAVLDAQHPGWGASGRNGGQVNPGLIEDPDEVEARFGPTYGPRMVQNSGNAGPLVFSLIDRHDIQCDANPVGWIRAAHNAKGLKGLEGKAKQWSRRGAPIDVLSKSKVAELIGTDEYVGGIIDRRGGNIHPLNYALGLADAAIRHGARIFGHSKVIKLETIGDVHHLHTAQGTIKATKVLICTNGYTDDLIPGLRQTVVPVRSIQVATKPLSDNVYKSILPHLHAPSDTRKLLLYFRKDASGRFIMGARGAYGDAATRRRQADARDIAVRMFPQLKDAGWDYDWGGFIAVTTDHSPHLNRLSNGIVCGMGYNGRGVAMATSMGKVLADWAQGVAEDDLDFPMTAPKLIPLHRFHRVGVELEVMRAKALEMMGF